MRLTRLVSLLSVVGLLLGMMVASVGASSHREAPLISTDAQADNTDLWAFVDPNAPGMLNIIAAYYSISDDVVKHSWRHTALMEGDAAAHLTKVSQEGYRVPKGREKQFAAYAEKFENWANSSLGSRSVADAQPHRVHSVKRGLDGTYWSFSESARKRGRGEEE